jgi:hypothetical protein
MASRPSSPQPRPSTATSSGAYGSGIAGGSNGNNGTSSTSWGSPIKAAGFVPKDAYQRRSNASSMNPLTGTIGEHHQPGPLKDANQAVFTSRGTVVEGFGSPRKSRNILEVNNHNPNHTKYEHESSMGSGTVALNGIGGRCESKCYEIT